MNHNNFPDSGLNLTSQGTTAKARRSTVHSEQHEALKTFNRSGYGIEFNTPSHRPGAYDAYRLPSMVCGLRVESRFKLREDRINTILEG